MVLFIHDVKKIKGAADKNGLKNATCKRTLMITFKKPPISSW